MNDANPVPGTVDEAGPKDGDFKAVSEPSEPAGDHVRVVVSPASSKEGAARRGGNNARVAPDDAPPKGAPGNNLSIAKRMSKFVNDHGDHGAGFNKTRHSGVAPPDFGGARGLKRSDTFMQAASEEKTKMPTLETWQGFVGNFMEHPWMELFLIGLVMFYCVVMVVQLILPDPCVGAMRDTALGQKRQ